MCLKKVEYFAQDPLLMPTVSLVHPVVILLLTDAHKKGYDLGILPPSLRHVAFESESLCISHPAPSTASFPQAFFAIGVPRVLACLSLNVPHAVIRVLADVFRHFRM